MATRPARAARRLAAGPGNDRHAKLATRRPHNFRRFLLDRNCPKDAHHPRNRSKPPSPHPRPRYFSPKPPRTSNPTRVNTPLPSSMNCSWAGPTSATSPTTGTQPQTRATGRPEFPAAGTARPVLHLAARVHQDPRGLLADRRGHQAPHNLTLSVDQENPAGHRLQPVPFYDGARGKLFVEAWKQGWRQWVVWNDGWVQESCGRCSGGSGSRR